MKEKVSILDKNSVEMDTCSGPAVDGACPRAQPGAVVPCAGHCILFAQGDYGSAHRPYVVPAQATYCPFTLAASLAVSSDFDQYET